MLRPCNLTQKQEEMFHRYCNSSATSLHGVYKTCSDNKEKAYKYCLRDMKEHGGQYHDEQYVPVVTIDHIFSLLTDSENK